MPTTTNTSTNFLQPNDPVVIDSVSLIADKTDGVLELSARTSAIGKSYTVYVTLSDGNPADSIEYPLVVNVVEDPTPPPPYLQTPNGSTSVHVVSGGSASLNLTAYVPPGDALAGYAAQFAYDSGTPSDGSCGFSAFNSTTGQTTITAAANFAGQTEVLVGVDAPSDSTPASAYDTMYVPVFVTPTAPGLVLSQPTSPGSVNSVTVNTSIPFTFTGVFPGATVKLFADGHLVGSATASDPLATYPTSVTITTNAGTTFSNGQHVFTATQEVSGTVANVPNRSEAYDLVSALSSTFTLTVASPPPPAATLPSSAAQFTLRKSGANVQLVTDSSGAVLETYPLSTTSQVQIVGAANKADQLTVNFAYGGFFTLPLGLTFAAGAGNPADSLVVLGANVANTFNLNGKMLAVDGLPINFAGVQNIKLVGGTASDYYTLVSSPANLHTGQFRRAQHARFFQRCGGHYTELGQFRGPADRPLGQDPGSARRF